MSRGTIHRTVRVEDGLWLPAKAKAEAEGRNLSDVIREALRDYITKTTEGQESGNDQGITI